MRLYHNTHVTGILQGSLKDVIVLIGRAEVVCEAHTILYI